VMALGGLAEVLFGVRAEQRSLEDIAEPLTSTDGGEAGGDGEAEPSDGARSRPAATPPLRPVTVVRRYRLGPGTSRAYAPWMSVSPDVDSARDLQREVDLIVAALRDRGELDRTALAAALRSRQWGPGRLRGALQEAVARGDVRRLARGRYAAVQPE
jgi:hypothetical protein